MSQPEVEADWRPGMAEAKYRALLHLVFAGAEFDAGGGSDQVAATSVPSEEAA